jgi:hypothetical protein
MVQGEFLKRVEVYLEGKLEPGEVPAIQDIAVNAMIVIAICNKE